MTHELSTIITITLTSFIICTILVSFALRHYLLNGRIVKNSSFSFEKNMRAIGLPYVTITNGDKTMNMLVDSGSNMSYLDSRYVECFKMKDLNKTSNTIGAGNSTLNTHHYVISFQYNGRIYKDVVGVVDLQHAFNSIKEESGVEIHGILGCQFFRYYHFVIDYDRQMFYQMKTPKEKKNADKKK